jgi:hypothetical protein
MPLERPAVGVGPGGRQLLIARVIAIVIAP